MRLLWIIGLFCFWGFAQPDPARAESPPPVAGLFGELSFGAAPTSTLLCIAGPCTEGEMAVSHRHPQQRVSVYKQPSAPTHIAGLEITAPQYSFHHEQLFQVTFRLDCEPELAELCMAHLLESVDRDQPLTLIEEHDLSWPDGEISSQQRFRSASGHEIRFDRSRQQGRWQQPLISIYDPSRMDAVRLAANPDYHPDDH